MAQQQVEAPAGARAYGVQLPHQLAMLHADRRAAGVSEVRRARGQDVAQAHVLRYARTSVAHVHGKHQRAIYREDPTFARLLHLQVSQGLA